MKRMVRALLVVLAFLCPLLLAAQERLRLEHADLMKGWQEGAETVRELIGSVIFSQDRARIRCDHALQYVDREKVELVGRVEMLEPPKQLNADYVLYFEKWRNYQAFGHVIARDSSRALHADTLSYIEKEDHLTTSGHVLMAENAKKVTLEGRQAEYWRSQGRALVVGRPVLTERDSTDRVVMTVTADSMFMLEDGGRYHMIGQVHIRRDTLDAYCGRLEYIAKGELLRLQEKPSAVRGLDYMRGQEIELALSKNRITAITLKKQSVVISRVDTLQAAEELYDLLTGDVIRVALQNDTVRQVSVKGQATSYYHVFENKEQKGLNKALGDEILIYFANNKVDRITVTSNPGSSNGVFFPPEKGQAIQAELNERLQEARQAASKGTRKRRDNKQ
jgi:lipopolysaccharide export system protein LptA